MCYVNAEGLSELKATFSNVVLAKIIAIVHDEPGETKDLTPKTCDEVANNVLSRKLQQGKQCERGDITHEDIFELGKWRPYIEKVAKLKGKNKGKDSDYEMEE